MPDDDDGPLRSEILDQLTALLPLSTVNVRRGRATSPHVHSLAVAIIRDALAEGHTIDRTNGDAPLADWDGWLVIETPILPTYIQTNYDNT